MFKHGINGYPTTGGTNVSGVASFNGRTGIVISQTGDYTALMVGADPTGTALSLLNNHISNLDPHIQYQKEDELEFIIDGLIDNYNNNINV